MASQRSAGVDITATLAAQKTSVIATLQTMRLDFTDANRLTVAVQAGTWSNDDKSELLAEITKVTSLSIAKPGQRRDSQECLNVELFLPEPAWVDLEKVELGLTVHVATIVGAAHSIGLILPNEKTLARMLSVVLAVCVKNRMDNSAVLKFFQEFKDLARRILASKPPYPYELLGKYPMRPEELPPHMITHAYGATGPVPDRAAKWPAIAAVYEGMPKRSSSSKISAPGDAQNMQRMIQDTVMKMMKGDNTLMLGNGGGENEDGIITMLNHKPRLPRRALPLQRAQTQLAIGDGLAGSASGGSAGGAAAAAAAPAGHGAAHPGQGAAAGAVLPPPADPKLGAAAGDADDGSEDSIERAHNAKIVAKEAKSGKSKKKTKKDGVGKRGEALAKWLEEQRKQKRDMAGEHPGAMKAMKAMKGTAEKPVDKKEPAKAPGAKPPKKKVTPEPKKNAAPKHKKGAAPKPKKGVAPKPKKKAAMKTTKK